MRCRQSSHDSVRERHWRWFIRVHFVCYRSLAVSGSSIIYFYFLYFSLFFSISITTFTLYHLFDKWLVINSAKFKFQTINIEDLRLKNGMKKNKKKKIYKKWKIEKKIHVLYVSTLVAVLYLLLCDFLCFLTILRKFFLG